MGTPCRIGVIKKDNTVNTIYCHWDGYPSEKASMLLNHYNSIEKANALVALGDISHLEKNIAPADGVEHSYDKPADEVTVAYHRDKGEPWNDVKPITSDNINQCLSDFGDSYLYLFDELTNQWLINVGFI